MGSQSSKTISELVRKYLLGSFGRLLLIRLMVMGSNFLCNLLIARELIFGPITGMYGLYAIGVGIVLFLPVMDLGLGQTIFNYYSKKSIESRDSQVFHLIFKRLVIVSLVWMLILITITFLIHQTFDTVFELEGNRSSWQLTLVTLTIYLLSIPFSIGFRYLHSIPRIDVALLIQSLVSPTTLIIIFLLNKNSTYMMFAVLITPAVLYLSTCIMAFSIALKFLTRREDVFASLEVKQLRMFQLGSWSTLLALTSVLLPFSPRIFFQVGRQSILLDQYSLLMTYLLPLMSIVSLFALSKNSEYRRIEKSSRFEWLTVNTKKSLILSVLLGLGFLVCSPAFEAFGLPVLKINLQIYIFLILVFYGAYFLPLSAQSDYSTLRKFAMLLLLLNFLSWALMSLDLIKTLDDAILVCLLMPAIIQTIIVWIQNFSMTRTLPTQKMNKK
jgi:hypothetical protein